MTPKILWMCLIEAEARAADTNYPADVRERSQETVDLCKQRMAMEGWDRETLRKLAKAK